MDGWQSLQPDEGKGKGKAGRAQGSAERLVAQRGQDVLALLLLPWRDLDPQALCYRGSDKVFQGKETTGRRGKAGGRGCPISLHRGLGSSPHLGSSLQAEAPCHVPVPPLVLASLAGHLPRHKSRGRRRRKDSGARPAAALPAESGGRRQQDTRRARGEVEERLSERGGMGSFPSPQSAPGRVSS